MAKRVSVTGKKKVSTTKSKPTTGKRLKLGKEKPVSENINPKPDISQTTDKEPIIEPKPIIEEPVSKEILFFRQKQLKGIIQSKV
jgi:hypothetical protein